MSNEFENQNSMREKIVFFILGAVLATIAYFVGNVNTVTANDELVVRRLTVSDRLILLGDAAIDGRLVVKGRIEVGFETNKPGIIMDADSDAAQILLTDTLPGHVSNAKDVNNDYYVLLIAGRSPEYMFRSAGIRIKEGVHKSLTINPE